MQLTYLQIKMSQNRPNHVFTSNQIRIKVPLMSLDVKKLKKGNNGVL